MITTRNLVNSEEEKNLLQKKLEIINWGQKNLPFNDLQITEGELNYEEEACDNVVDLSDNELITVHKSEYEEIKNRVSALEEDLDLLTSVHSVQYAYEKILEKSEKLNDEPAEQLAKRLSKELKIRLSSENKVMRSPSARKIGSFRRRSRELVQRNSEPKSNLRRGRPNTVMTGLPSPRLRAMSNESIPVPKTNLVTRSSTFRSAKDDWKSGEAFFGNEHLLRKVSPLPQGRPSLAEIRCQNAGMVLEKAKLFNSLNESKDIKMTRRQSIRLENLRRLNDADKSYKKMLTRTRSTGSDKKLKNSSLLLHESVIQYKANKDTKEANHESQTPKAQRFHTPLHGSRKETPAIKKSLITRSPRNFAKTPMSQLRSNNRTRATPMKVLAEAGSTPRIGLRRSPRFLARSLSVTSRLKD